MTAGEDGSTPECVGVLEDVNERRQAQDRVAHMAHHDPLTGLANRVLLRTRLEEAIRYAGRGRHAALHCLDLDRFKEVNDAHGHAIGDRLLNGVADRLRACTRDVDVIARLGGDEFAIIQFDGGRDGSADTLARRLVEALCRPYELDGLMVVVGASVGIATINDINNGPDVLLRHADLALYRAKEEGRGCYRFFEPEMDAGMPERPRLKLDLRRAATANEFEPWYQPRINLRDASLSGFEALMRWNHPVHGVLPPARFLPGLEETGLIRQVGQDLLVKACREAVRWPVSLRLSVNLSAAQLLQHDIVAVVAHALDSTGLAAERLELEVTETAINADPEAAAKALAQLHALGVRLAMDDFGAGHSSLGCLRTLPFDRVKIDRSFVRTALHDDQSRAMIRAVISLCADLGIETTAVGVESEDQLALLTVGTCSEAQGYLFGAPRPLADLARRPSPILDMPRPTALVGPGDVSTVD
jgi:diguanylate cyclase (GGDEF)-like protein